MYYDDVEYAAKRLNNSLIRKNSGNPFFVTDTFLVGADVVCFGRDMVSFMDTKEKLSDLNINPVSLGFVNIEGNMIFACRKPMRKDWKQGLSVANLVLYGAEKRGFDFSSLSNTILNIFPSFITCLECTKKNKSLSMAFSRDFGLTSEGNSLRLVYRKYVVGTVTENIPVLTPEKFFLEQHLRTAMRFV